MELILGGWEWVFECDGRGIAASKRHADASRGGCPPTEHHLSPPFPIEIVGNSLVKSYRNDYLLKPWFTGERRRRDAFDDRSKALHYTALSNGGQDGILRFPSDRDQISESGT